MLLFRLQRRLVVPFCLMLASVGVAFGAADASPCKAWGGVWHVVPSKAGEGQAVHLSISTSEKPLRVLYFGYDFTSVGEASAVKCDDTSLEFDSLPRGKAFHLALKRDGDRVSGEMAVVHPQYKMAYGRVGHRVSTNEQWDPVKDVVSLAGDDGLIDLTLTLVEEAPRASLEEFEAYWASSIEPKFYSVVHDVIYGPEGDLDRRRKQLGVLLEKLNREGFAKRIREVADLHKEVVARIKKEAPELYFPNVFLSMPSLGDFKTSVLSAQGTMLLRLGTDTVELEGDALRAWLAQQHLMVPLYQAFPPVDESLVARTIREGLATRFAGTVGLADHPLQVLGEPSPDGTRTSSEALGELKKKFVAGIRNPAVARNVTPEEILLVGYDFAHQMTTAYSTAEVLALDRGNLSDRLWSYLTAAQ